MITVNVAFLGLVAFFLLDAARTSDSTAALPASYINTDVAAPLDQLSSVDIAVNVARTVNLAESIAVTNQSDSAKVATAIAPADAAVAAKPQIVTAAVKSVSDIQKYTVVAGDTVSSVAGKFGITSDSIRWSNAITGESLRPGFILTIPPVSGVVYTVRSGDTPESLATKYKASKEQIIAFNDAELSGLVVGRQIVIPGGQQPAVVQYSASFAARYGYNGYDYGWCTYYAAARVSVPVNWGNANTWDNRARQTPGWIVSSTPVAGAILQTDRGSMGHVGYVEAVSADGTMIKYSDMNGLAGWNRVGFSDWVPASKFPNYIYRQ